VTWMSAIICELLADQSQRVEVRRYPVITGTAVFQLRPADVRSGKRVAQEKVAAPRLRSDRVPIEDARRERLPHDEADALDVGVAAGSWGERVRNCSSRRRSA